MTIWYLEMRSKNELRPRRVEDPRFRVLEATVPQWEFNRFLYLSVGRNWAWNDRRGWTDDQWRAHVGSDRLRTFVAYYDGSLAGYFELVRDNEDGVEILYFGLIPEFIGKGLGGHLLTEALEAAWSMQPKRVWVHTCSLDHPSARRNYEARGMLLYKTDTLE
jgi:ribosomal protein S18 acetylase RimI-like enzyme